MVIGVLKVEIYMGGNRSLKEKRQIIKKILGRVRSKFVNISVSEVDSLNLWNNSTLGFSFVSNDTPHVNSILDQLQLFIKDNGYCRIVSSEIDIIHF